MLVLRVFDRIHKTATISGYCHSSFCLLLLILILLIAAGAALAAGGCSCGWGCSRFLLRLRTRRRSIHSLVRITRNFSLRVLRVKLCVIRVGRFGSTRRYFGRSVLGCTKAGLCKQIVLLVNAHVAALFEIYNI